MILFSPQREISPPAGGDQRALRSVRGYRPLFAENSITWSFPGAQSPLETFAPRLLELFREPDYFATVVYMKYL